MSLRRRGLVVGLLAAVVGVAVAIAVLGPSGPEGVTPREKITGVIVGIDSAGLDQVEGFELRTTENEIMSFAILDLENGAEFPPGHLAEHQATAEPVTVTYQYQGPTRVALRIDDAS